MIGTERTGWRDAELRNWHLAHGFDYPKDEEMEMSQRHQRWGPVCGVDIDWLYVEYNYGISLAVIDYAHREGLICENDKKLDKERNYNNKALIDLGNRANLPFYVNYYIKAPWTFRIFPMNDKAQELAPKQQILTELDYVVWLHDLRGYQISEYIARKCNDQICWESLKPPKHKSKKNHNTSPYTLFNQTPILQQEWEIGA